MSASLSVPMIVEVSWTTRVMTVLGNAARRVNGKTALATLALIAAMMAWNWVRWLGEMTPGGADGYPPEIWWSILCIETLCNALLVVAVLVADSAVDAGAPRALLYATAVVLSAALGAWLQPDLRHAFGLRVGAEMPGRSLDDLNGHPWSVFFDLLQRSGLLVFVYVNQRTTVQARNRQQAAEIARATARRRTLESRLQAMQARVEPQFLLTTLAQVGQLYESNPVLADAMLDDLIAYLRAALPHLRESSSTLGKESALASAYLNIVRVSTGGRLAFDFDVADDVRTAQMPAMVLLPLISHVLAARRGPAHAEGRVGIAARVADDRLVLTVTGSGSDFVAGEGDQELADLRVRIHALYGDEATLHLALAQPRGLGAVLAIPYEGGADAGYDPAHRSPRTSPASIT